MNNRATRRVIRRGDRALAEIEAKTNCGDCGLPWEDCWCNYDRYDDDDERYCYDCGDRGWVVDCIDDLCYGSSGCIHGDGYRRCRYCNADGMKDLEPWNW